MFLHNHNVHHFIKEETEDKIDNIIELASLVFYIAKDNSTAYGPMFARILLVLLKIYMLGENVEKLLVIEKLLFYNVVQRWAQLE